jgi:hypothetical protein
VESRNKEVNNETKLHPRMWRRSASDDRQKEANLERVNKGALFRGYIDKLNMGQGQDGAAIWTLVFDTDDTIIQTEVLATRGAKAKNVKGNKDLKVGRICNERDDQYGNGLVVLSASLMCCLALSKK